LFMGDVPYFLFALVAFDPLFMRKHNDIVFKLEVFVLRLVEFDVS
jgi:hypothetical protein